MGSVRRNPAANLTSRGKKWGRDALSLRRAARATKSPTNRARRRSRRDSRTRRRNGCRRKARENESDAVPRSLERGGARPRALFRVNARRRARASLYTHTGRSRVTRAPPAAFSAVRSPPETPTRTGSLFAPRFRRARARRFRLECASARRFRRDRRENESQRFSETLFWSPRFRTHQMRRDSFRSSVTEPRARHSATHARARRDVPKNARRRKTAKRKIVRHDCLRRRPWS